MREDRLLERLRAQKGAPARRAKDDPRKVVESVLRHLQRILNTRQGSAQTADDYGMPDFTGLVQNSESLRDVERAIRQTIMTYEPRLTGVKIRFVQQENEYLKLSFQIMAKLVTRDERRPIVFESYVESGGKFKIRM